MKKNWVYIVRRIYTYKSRNDIAVGGPMTVWCSLQGWVDKRRLATFFSSKVLAESRLLLIAAEKPEFIGSMEVVRLTRRKWMTVDV